MTPKYSPESLSRATCMQVPVYSSGTIEKPVSLIACTVLFEKTQFHILEIGTGLAVQIHLP